MSDFATRVAATLTTYSKSIIIVLLISSIAISAGAVRVEQTSSLDQFQSDTPESAALEYIQSNFTAGDQNITTVQVIVRGSNVLDKQSLLAQLQFQAALHTDNRVQDTLTETQPTISIASLLATTAIRQETAAELRARGNALQELSNRLNGTQTLLVATLKQGQVLQHRYDELNRSYRSGQINESTYRSRAAAIESQLTTVRQSATGNITAYEPLGPPAADEFSTLFSTVRTLQRSLDAVNQSYREGEINQSTYEQRITDLRTQLQATYRGVAGVLAPAYQTLQQRVTFLETDRRILQNKIQNGSIPSLTAQIEQLHSMNVSAIDRTITQVLGSSSGSSTAFGLMPTTYSPGSTTAEATMIVVQQTTEDRVGQGASTPRIETSQLAIQSMANDRFGPDDDLVFGAGIVGDEITRSMTDSLAIVGPLALLFVLVVLIIAYRDPLDIVLGLLGIGLVLSWTFGFMGWVGIDFNQIFIAIPVLLIGLSIDYAIHVFMRHREERSRGASDGVRGSMRTALASVGIALALVTATTVIGFLSNLISSVPPIREFGIVSAFGISAAFIVFGALIPAIKVEIDSVLEGWGYDRRKRAFGTGGGRLGRVLSVGGIAARRGPWVVILLTLLVSAAGTYGATQVDTTFDQTDFLAEDPSAWMDQLPDPFDPGEYTVKQSFTYANEHFVREDSQGQILVRGDITDPAVLQRLATAQDRAASSAVVVVLSNGEPDLRGPLTVLHRVAERNQTVQNRLAATDTDGDGIPDRNVATVFDALFAAAPQETADVIYREDGTYQAMRLVVSVQGGTSGDRVTQAMRGVASTIEGPEVTVIATGSPIVFDIVSEQLLDTVIESLLITLLAIFLFLMVTYRLTEGSALLGVVTLLPVAFSVSWILGSMYLLGIPFNVLTGLITSLTVGLGVAYSIHISERFSHELDREPTTWQAMNTALQGTGGALLGSAATTVGGFGVLGFAILPPLRQFGIITGLTIIYAFLASVLLLPSLLVLWVRYLGPGIEEPDGTHRTAEQAPTSPGTHHLVGGHRTLAQSVTYPGGSYEATITLEPVADRIVLRERPPGTDYTVTDFSPVPVSVVTTAESLYLVWEEIDDRPVTVTYTAQIQDEPATESTLPFDGSLQTSDGLWSVGGTTSVEVLADLDEWILDQSTVTTNDLRAAGDAYEDGVVTEAQFERVYSKWVDGSVPAREDTRPEDGGD